jgi:orotate phosphoribosyltransferase
MDGHPIARPLMTGVDAERFVALVSGRRGHFRLESGHHSRLWLDLDALFVDAAAVVPFVAALAESLRKHDVDVVCGPLLGGAFLAQLVAQALRAEFAYTERMEPERDRGLFEVRYRLPGALRTRIRGQRVAMVDDVMSAGSALRGTYAELLAHGAVPVVAGALLVLGDVGATFFRQRGVPVEAAARDAFELWAPAECPLCVAGIPLDDLAATATA